MTTHKLTELIRNDRSHGATELALIALGGIASLEIEPSELIGLIETLKAARPSMSALQVLLTRLELRLGQQPAAIACGELIEEVRAARLQAAAHMATLIDPGDVLMTHSLSSTVKEVFTMLSRANFAGRIIVTESRPGDEGKLLVASLLRWKLSVTYITEAQINLLMPETDKVLLGADTVLADGSIINKVGSSLMALSAVHHQVPVYVCAEEFKQLDRQDCELEQMDPAELGLSLEGVDVRNTWFERIPSALITRWVR